VSISGEKAVAKPESRRVRVTIIDDQALFRDGLANLIAHEPDMEVLGTADTISVAAEMVRQNVPDVLLLGWPAGSSQRLFSAIAEARLVLRVILLTNGEAKDDHVEAVRQGCCGIVPRNTSTELLLKSIRKVHAGEFWLDRTTTAEVIRRLAKRTGSSGANTATRLGVRENATALSTREREIVMLVAQGFKNKEMAERMFISEQTVKNHLHNIFDKLGVSDRLELALFAIHHNLHETA
jgi:two-component system, NarL family, nitrate/nitrite response regulator NarL